MIETENFYTYSYCRIYHSTTFFHSPDFLHIVHSLGSLSGWFELILKLLSKLQFLSFSFYAVTPVFLNNIHDLYFQHVL